MAPKKKTEDEGPKPEDFLPAHLPLGCQVYWVEVTLPPAENGDVVSCGHKGVLEKVHDLAQPGNRIEFVQVQFEGHEESTKVLFSGLSSEPPSLEQLKELSTGLVLPLRGVEVTKLWQQSGLELHEEMDALLELEVNFTDPTKRDIARDFHIFSLEHARSIALTVGQAAVFHAIMARVLEFIRNNKPTAGALDGTSKCFEEFKDLVVQHAANDPPSRLAIFSAAEARLLVDFATGTVFKHFLLYQCCVHEEQQVEHFRTIENLERPLKPPDLNLPGTRQQRRRNESSKATDPDVTGVLDASLAADGEGLERGETPTEEEEIERAVRERLRETQTALEKRLEDRDAAFQEKLQAAPKKKK